MFNSVARDAIKFIPIHAALGSLSIFTLFFLHFLACYILDYAVIDYRLISPPSFSIIRRPETLKSA